ncbi:MAG TPA: hypothetical protein VKX28_26905 [Xanthobacteraceae bacterium]|nr:hypothetical protein [Xanthobacteraceae bacterium]
MTDIVDELAIIAKDGGRLSPRDCALIARAAAELEHTSALLIKTQAAMLEAQAKQLATAERLLEQRRPALAHWHGTFVWPAGNWSIPCR